MKQKIVTFIDIGTNSIRLLIVRLNPDHSYKILLQEKEVTRLGENEFLDGNLKPEAIERAAVVCRKFYELAKTYNSDYIYSVATSAVREARNRKDFLSRIEKESGLDVRVIPGHEEARLIYLGMSAFASTGKEKAVYIDVGGGSTELIVGDQYQHSYLESLRLGAIRLTNLFLPDGGVNRVDRKTYSEMKRYVKNIAFRALEEIRKRKVKRAYGSSGTFINLAEIVSQTNISQTNGRILTLRRKEVKAIARKLCSLDLEERKKIPRINKSRADIIIAGAAIIEALMEELGLSEIRVMDRALIHGMLSDYLAKQKGFPQYRDIPIKEKSVLRLGTLYNINKKHAETVSNLSLQLFDSARKLRIHRLGKKERELLKYAAYLHDIGDFISYTDHHNHSYYIIKNAELLGFDQKEIDIIAATAKYHTKKTPKKKDAILMDADKHSMEVITILSTLLRIAENLDRSHGNIIKKAVFTKNRRGEVTLTITSRKDASLEKWGAESNACIFEKTFGRKLKIKEVRRR